MSIQNNDVTVEKVMLPLEKFPVVATKTILKEAMEAMNAKGLGIVCIVDQAGKLQGIVTDGDIRRKLLKVQKPFSAFFVDDALDHAIISPLTADKSMSLVEAIEIMDSKKVWDLPVTDADNKLVGLLHLHPAVDYLLKNG